MLPPFPHFAAAASVGLVLFGLFPTLAGATTGSVALGLGGHRGDGRGSRVLVWDRHAPYAAAGLYVLGVAAVGLGLAELRPGRCGSTGNRSCWRPTCVAPR